MKILFFSETFGNATFIRSQVEQVAKTNQILYICNKAESHVESSFHKVIPFCYSWFLKVIRDRLEMHQIYLTFWNIQFAKKLKESVKKFNPDIVHLQFGYEAIKFLDNYVNHLTPVIIHFRGYDASKMLGNRAYVKRLKSILKKQNIYTVSVCYHLLNNLRAKGINFHNEPRVIYSNTDTDFFRRVRASNSGTFTFVQVSSFREKKGHSYSLSSFRSYLDEVGDSNLRIILIGKREGPYYKKIRKMVESLQLIDYVHFTGQLTQMEIREWLEEAHCVFQHSVTSSDGDQEGVPNALMEAMSMELPIVSTNHAGIPELFSAQNFGWLVDEFDVEGMSQAIKGVISNFHYSSENRQKIIDHFSKTSFEESILNLYQQLLT